MPSPSTTAGKPSLPAASSVNRSNSIANELSEPSLLFDTTVRPSNAKVTSSPDPPKVATDGAPGRLPPNPVASTPRLPAT